MERYTRKANQDGDVRNKKYIFFVFPYKLDNKDTQFTSIHKTDGSAVILTVSCHDDRFGG